MELKDKATSSDKSADGLRGGEDFLSDLRRRRRSIYVDGEVVSNPADHPAFREGARSIARLFDFAAAPENRDTMTYRSPDTGKPIWRGYQIPHTHAELAAKRIAAEKWAEESFGLMGRTPDHVSNFFAGFAAKPDFFGERQFIENMINFYKHARETHAYISYAIVPPQVDRSKPAHRQKDPTLYAGVVKETDAGIYLSGGQQLATGGVYSDYLFVSCIQPLQAGDEAYAFSVVIPSDDPNLRLYARRPYASVATSQFDYPLSS